MRYNEEDTDRNDLDLVLKRGFFVAAVPHFDAYRRLLIQMALLTCRLCRKIFTAAGGRTCPACKQRLDELYVKVRDFLRDNPKLEANVESLSTSLEADIRDIQALVDMGYLDRDLKLDSAGEETDRQKLALEFERSLNEMKSSAAAAPQRSSVSYGQQLYSDKGRRR